MLCQEDLKTALHDIYLGIIDFVFFNPSDKLLLFILKIILGLELMDVGFINKWIMSFLI